MQNILVTNHYETSFSNEVESYPLTPSKNETIIQCFEEQVKKNPNDIALISENSKLSYYELNVRANILGEYLRTAYDIEPDMIVPIISDRSEWMIVALLGVLKSGGAYLPIDSEYPRERIVFMLQDSNASVLLCDDANIKQAKQYTEHLNIASFSVQSLDYTQRVTNPKPIAKADDLAYLIYTSGSTGKPKGVMIEHGGFVNMMEYQIKSFNVVPSDNIIQFASFSFDASVYETFLALLSGATYVTVKKEEILNRFVALTQEYKINTAVLNPTFLAMVGELEGFKTIITAGEKAIASDAMRYAQKCQYINAYGPSEVSICSAFYHVDAEKNYQSIPIGKSINKMQNHILDQELNELPKGEIGEICMTGVGLARGYLNRDALTKEKFVQYPRLGRLYRSGDLGRCLQDGTIEYIGRMDEQVKIRGYRIELGEIENTLLAIEGVQSAVVIERNQELFAYMVMNSSSDEVIAGLKERLKAILPEYMTPNYFIPLDVFPLTPNGKIDKKALPLPQKEEDELLYVAPQTETEKKLSSIWCEVLKREKISTHQNFFEMGGNSLLVIAVISKVSKLLNVQLEIKMFFETPTLSELAKRIESLRPHAFIAIEPIQKAPNYPLSNAQKRVWLQERLEGGFWAYNEVWYGTFEREINETVLNQALTILIQNHEILRTNFREIEGEPRQVIGEKRFYNICESIETDNAPMDYMKKMAQKVFDLEKDLLMEVKIINKKIFFLNIHHIICDGWSINLMVKELSSLYNALLGGEEPIVIAPKIHYKEYTAWQNQNLTDKGYLTRHQNYWHNKLEGHQPLDFPTDFKRPHKQSFKGKRQSFCLDKRLGDKLNALSQESTLFSTLLTLINTLIYNYTQQEDILIGTVVANREHPDTLEQIGFYVNTLPLRNHINAKESFRENLLRIQAETLESFAHQSYPFDQLIGELDLERDLSQHPLFNILMVLQNNEQSQLDFGEDRGELKAIDTQTSKFDMLFEFNEKEGELLLNIEYNTQIFAPSTIERIFLNLETLVESMEQDKSLNELVVISDRERVLLESFNPLDVEYPRERSIVELFEEQVIKQPHHTALIHQQRTMSYFELNAKANQLASYLLKFNIKTDDLIPLCMERSEEMVISILAILKVGGAYVPIDSSYPQERIEYILKDCNAKILLTQKSLAKQLASTDAHKVLVDKIALDGYFGDNLHRATNANQLACVIYTSGSTGNPKGVMLEHRGVVGLVKEQNYIPLDGDTIMLQSSSTSFDAITFELWGTLLNGGKLVLYPSATIDMEEYNQTLKEHHINTLLITSRLFDQWVENTDKNSIETLKYVLTGGEVVLVPSVKKLYAINPNLTILNVYGPTESTTLTSSYPISKEENYSTIPIGRPIAYTQIYILDNLNKAVPLGAKGELCIGGNGLARGYLNQKALTDEKFITHPQHGRLYKTGDIVRYLEDGNIDYIGRVDDQVKIRGFRIELGEIENAILKQKRVKKCLVIAKSLKEHEAKVLVAYVALKGETQTDKNQRVEELKEKLKTQLPHYMMPSYFVVLSDFPLTQNGKMDIKALPLPALTSTKSYIAPIDEKERLLVEVFASVLNVASISTKDNFFDIGGDSIKAIQITAKVASKGYQLKVEDIFKADSIQALAHALRERREVINQEVVVGEIPLTPIQSWFFDLAGEKNHFNQSVLLEAKEPLNQTTVQSVLHKLQEHHDLLRVSYAIENEEIKQFNHDVNSSIECDVVELTSELEMKKIITEEEASFNIANQPLMRVVLFKQKECKKGFSDKLFITIHHLIVDGISWRVLLEDFNRLYQAYKKEESITLPQKTTSFKRYAQRLEEYAQTIEEERDYWSKVCENNPMLPVDKPIDKRLSKNQKELTFSLTKAQTSTLLTGVGFAYNTEINDILLTALSRTLYKIFNINSTLITLEGHGREAVLDIDISRTIGWFTSVYPVALDYDVSRDIGYQIKSTKESLRAIPHKGIGYGLLKYRDNNQVLDYHPEVAFNYLGVFDAYGDDEVVSLCEENGFTNPMSDDFTIEHRLNINAIVTGSEFKFFIGYDQHEYMTQMMESLASILKSSLLETISHCLEQTNSTLTPSDLSVKDMSIESLEQLLSHQDEPYLVQDIYPLTSLQEGMLFHSIEQKSGSPYFEQLMFDIKGELDASLLQKSLQQLVSRHDILRTRFIYGESINVKQLVYKESKANFFYQDIQNKSHQTALIKRVEKQEREAYFNLSKENPFRVKLFKTDKKNHRILISFHHILLDGWSMGLLFEELFSSYSLLTQNQDITFAPSIAYGEYVAWLRQTSQEESKAFWQEYLRGYENESTLPKKCATQEYQTDVFTLTINRDRTDRLNSLTQHHSITLNILMETLFGILLSKYNNTQDIVFGTTVSGRNGEVEGIDKILGLFINTIPVRVNYSREDTLRSLFELIISSSIEAKGHHHYSLADIQNLTPLKGSLINQLMVFESYPMSKEGLSDAFEIGEIENFSQTNYDLNVIVYPAEQLSLKFQYNAKSLSLQTIKNISASFEKLIAFALEEMEMKISKMDILSSQEHQALALFNSRPTEYPKDKSVMALFEEQVTQNPNATALVYENREMSYGELNNRANILGRYLKEHYEVQPDTIIPIMTSRNEWMVIAILGVLKAGGAYLPLDMEYPAERIEFMLSDTEAKLILCDGVDLEWELDIDRLNIKLLNYHQKEQNLELVNDASDLLYVIYTSGSTGTPKGVMVEHRGVVRLVKEQNYVPLNQDTIMLQSSSVAFDATTFELWGTLLNGGKLVLYPFATIDIEEYNQVLQSYQINTIWLTARLFDQWVENTHGAYLQTLKYVLTGGDVVASASVKKLYSLSSTVEIINGYGPTESTTFASTHAISRERNYASVPIGKPLANTQIYILNQQHQAPPMGARGELCIGGDGVARGYLNQEELTAEKFIQHPQYGRLYKTGDVAKYLEDGNIEYLGRMDNQVKIRGFRVELEEIEQVILRELAITDCVVIPKSFEEDENRVLIAYVVFRDKQDIESLKASLQAQLAHYMMPNYFVMLQKMPLTSNGKIDKKSLPLPTQERQSSYVVPTTQTQFELVNIFSRVLKLSKGTIGIEDSFFEIGGHSLTGMSAISLINKQFSVKIKLKDFFINPTITRLSTLIDTTTKEVYLEIEPMAKQSDYTLSHAQRSLWLLDKMHNGFNVYNMPNLITFNDEVEEGILNESFTILLGRHEILRTNFKEINGEVRQVISPKTKEVVNAIILADNEIECYVENEMQHIFDLENDTLVYATLINGRMLFINMHHIISDGWSLSIIMEELSSIYTALLTHQSLTLAPLLIHYKEYAHWQERQLNQEDYLKPHQAYWHNALSDAKRLEFPLDFPRPAKQSFEGRVQRHSFSQSIAQKLQRLTHQGTLFSTLVTVINILFSKYSNQEDIVIGTPVANRGDEALFNQIGFYVNTLVLRNRLALNETFRENLQQIEEQTLEAFEHQSYPFDMLVDELDLERDMSQNPLFNIMLVLQNNETQALQFGELTGSQEALSFNFSKFDMTLSFEEQKNGLELYLEYNSSLFKETSIERLILNLETLIDNIEEDKKLSDIEMISPKEQERLAQFNSAIEPYLTGTLIEHFEKQVERTPHGIALVYEQRELTYRELNSRANHLAVALKENHHISLDSIVAIMVEKSEWIVISILAVLKAGGAYLPLDPEYPQERIEFMLKDSETSLLLCDNQNEEEAKNYALNMHIEHFGIESLTHNEWVENLETTPNPNDLAYIIYTSGSTGTPKGVMIEHRSILNTIWFQIKDFDITPEDRVLQFASFSFDGSVAEIFGSLLGGATLVMVSKNRLLDNPLRELQSNAITVGTFPPSFLNVIEKGVTGFKTIVSAGETAVVKDALQHAQKTTYINGYGPTENSICTTTYHVDAKEVYHTIPIGRPVPNTQLYILNQHDQPMPLGAIGELSIGGAGLARGYLNRKALTNEKFISHPTLGRLYKTGDLARYLDNGNIEYMGRIDEQVKIRGFRVELGEIENSILADGSVEEVVVMAKVVKENQNAELVAYLLLDATTQTTVEEIRQGLKSQLPHYMMPSYFVALEVFPRTPNGKVDKKALPNPIGLVSDKTSMGATNLKEEIIIEAFNEVLGTKSIGIEDNFFDIGGDSIKAIQISSKIANQGYALPIQHIFQAQNIKELAHYLEAKTEEIAQDMIVGEVELTPIQAWFFGLEGDKNHFNQSVMLKSKEPLEEKRLREVFLTLQTHHDALRMNYITQKDVVSQSSSDIDYPIDVTTIRVEKISEIEELTDGLQASLDIERNPLMKVVLFKTKDHADRVLIIIHHLVVDGVSWRVLLEDINSLYGDKTLKLPPKTVSFQAYAKELQNYGKRIAPQTKYWREITAQAFSLPTDNRVSKRLLSNRKTQTFKLSALMTQDLLENINFAYNTEINDILLTALMLALYRAFNQEQQLITLEGHGREEALGINISRTVGWFTSTYPVAFTHQERGLGYQIQAVKESLHQTPDKGIGYGVLKYLMQEQGIDYTQQVSFNYLGELDSSFNTPLFEMAEQDVGNPHAGSFVFEHKLGVNAVVIQQQFQLTLDYDQDEYNKESIERFGYLYKTALKEIIYHCKEQQQSVISPSDITDDDFDIDTLNELLTEFSMGEF